MLREAREGTQIRAGTWRQELVLKPWGSAAYWLAPYGLLSLLSYRTQGYEPRDICTHNELGSLHC